MRVPSSVNLKENCQGMGAFDSPDVYYPFNGARYVHCRIIGYRNFDYWEGKGLSPRAVFGHIAVDQRDCCARVYEHG